MELQIFRNSREVMHKRPTSSFTLGMALIGAAGIGALAARDAIGRIGKGRSRRPDKAASQAVAERPDDLVFELIERRVTVTQVRVVRD